MHCFCFQQPLIANRITSCALSSTDSILHDWIIVQALFCCTCSKVNLHPSALISGSDCYSSMPLHACTLKNVDMNMQWGNKLFLNIVHDDVTQKYIEFNINSKLCWGWGESTIVWEHCLLLWSLAMTTTHSYWHTEVACLLLYKTLEWSFPIGTHSFCIHTSRNKSMMHVFWDSFCQGYIRHDFHQPYTCIRGVCAGQHSGMLCWPCTESSTSTYLKLQ